MEATMLDNTPAPLFSEADLATINAARDVLDRASSDALSAAYKLPGFSTDAGASDYARVSVLATVAANALFDLLNSTKAYGVQHIPSAVMHREKPEVVA